jgi:hypothetical protein
MWKQTNNFWQLFYVELSLVSFFGVRYGVDKGEEKEINEFGELMIAMLRSTTAPGLGLSLCRPKSCSSNLHSGGKMATRWPMHLNYICAYNKIN